MSVVCPLTGFWSAGTRLEDSALVRGDAATAGQEMPEYICGGANTG